MLLWYAQVHYIEIAETGRTTDFFFTVLMYSSDCSISNRALDNRSGNVVTELERINLVD